MFELSKPSALVEIQDSLLLEKEVRLWIKREDQIDPVVSGNKWRKLKYNFIEAQDRGFNRILTFGGAYSNHIVATATAAKKYGFNSIGIIRGDELNPDSNETLQKAHRDGMNLIFISRQEYKQRERAEWVNNLENAHQAFVIPEGGSNLLALDGVGEMVKEINQPFEYLVCPIGTGGTLAGIATSLDSHQNALGIAVLNAASYLDVTVSRLMSDAAYKRCQINHDYHFGGYAKFDGHLIQFISEFYSQHAIPLDPIYTGKMMFGLYDLIYRDYFPKNSQIIAIHTGGLQGVTGFNQKHGFDLKNY